MSVVDLPNGDLGYINSNGTLYIANGDTANCTVAACPIELSTYGYRPSIGASSALIALYAICMVAQTYLGIRYKKWGFMAAMVSGCLVEILGYVGRILYWDNPWGEAGFIMQIVLITIGPVFFSAAIYVLLAQIVQYVCVAHSRFAPKWFYWIFIPCDIISLILQAAGGAMSSTSDGGSDAGVDIALAGLAFQVITLVAFAGLAADYAIRSRSVWMSVRWPKAFLWFLIGLIAGTLFITIRCCYRVYELSEGYSRDSEALRDEPLFIALESVMVVLAAYCLIVAHPGFVFKTGNEHLASDEWIAEKGLKKADSSSANDTPDTVSQTV